MKSSRIVSAVVLLVASIATYSVNGQSLASVPGAKTATGALASSVDGMSRYLAPDGPIQPAITAIGGLPMRAAEQLNNGVGQISLGLDRGAQSLSRSAGNDGTIRMPGMDALESSMPASVAGLGTMMHGMIQSKNQFIAGQAERGVQAGERLRSMMAGGIDGLRTRSSGRMGEMGKMVSSVQDNMMKGASSVQNQLKRSLDGHMNRLQSVQGIGQNVRNQAQGIGQTLHNGLSGTMNQLQRTGQEVQGQIQNGLKQNMGAMQNIMGSMQGSMGEMGNSMQNNVQGLIKHAQDTAQQVTSHIHQAASGPLSMIQNLGSSLGNMMPSGGMSVMSKGRY